MPRAYNADRVLGEVEKILNLGRGGATRNDRVSNIRSYVTGMADTGCQPDDPVREFASLAADQWSSMILLVLRDGPFRYSILHRLVGAIGVTDGISQRILTLKLKKLHHNGLIIRTIENEAPIRISYSLSPLGRSFIDEIEHLAQWIIGKLPEIHAARASNFDETEK
ncbi:helix-turn-helix transcriptional regulator [Agrobacterium rhizogenes]|uniref:Transcriptional regulator n=1 Tax=Rhizobium rhizogenes (strain K84 / ATCC BAA-868) TaxID=311403 RepID=B9JQA2_RHIR8|nr:helix-turn-helix domain-containing protein [Rhizobium rhizogenes]ACM31321.1 transcriptional regulator [Rhizobium rhizogenes K84]NTI46272.1 helix-turn-helix transcriptional regulator [Rhizobium rhizogenes]NTI52955.1 helix-turn-helix transcriptional regulator [Rhizobium rhizogenes]NTI98328.1 helix-turn-helix transcriptional regulator [Rhizobium rhizogenes]NTJ60757.1 helix-turn-helix transcriptional regulator [Rhizobium rhizogenes]